MTPRTRSARLVFAALALLFAVVPADAYTQNVGAGPVELGSLVRTRGELEELLEFYEQVLLSPAYSEDLMASTRAKADRVRERLTLGDFRVGDAVVLTVRGELELPDTIYVEAGPRIDLDLFGDVELAGVLRSELEETIQEALALFIRDPVVQAEALLRISVLGAVNQPGFFVVPADMLISTTLMVAGGPGSNAQLEDLRIERGTAIVMEGEELQEALRLGHTLDQLNLQAGDQIVLPAEAAGGFMGNIGVILGLVGTITLLITRIAN